MNFFLKYNRFFVTCLSILLLFSCSSNNLQESPQTQTEDALEYILESEEKPAIDSVSFPEIWAYLIAGSEENLKAEFPLTDIGYFGAEVDTYGNLIGVPNPKDIAYFSGKIHLVVVCNSTALTHFVLESEGTVRERLIEELVAATEPFDGLQIDFELVPKRDGEEFFSFLQELRVKLPNKMLTVALPARLKVIENDVYDYSKISSVTDRVFVMAYDEHWSTSSPGPIASMDWCENVAKHSINTIGQEKLIMGLPFYGRTWGSVSLNRAFYFSGIQRIMKENQVKSVQRENDIPTFTYQIPSVTVTGYYEDVYSLCKRLSVYKNMGIEAVGFWCLGQEDSRIWEYLSVK